MANKRRQVQKSVPASGTWSNQSPSTSSNPTTPALITAIGNNESVTHDVTLGVLTSIAKGLISNTETVDASGFGVPVFYNSVTTQRERATRYTTTPSALGINATTILYSGVATGTFAAADVGRFVYLDDNGGLYAHPSISRVKIGFIKSTTQMIVSIGKENQGNFSWHPKRTTKYRDQYASFGSRILISKKQEYKMYLQHHFSTNQLTIENIKTGVRNVLSMGIDGNGMCEVTDYDYLMIPSRFSGVFRVLDQKTESFVGGSYSVTGSQPNPGYCNSIIWMEEENQYATIAGDFMYFFYLTDPIGAEPFDWIQISSGYSNGGDRIRDKQALYHKKSRYAYIPNSNVGTVTIVDCVSRTILATVSNGQVNNKIVREESTDLLMLTTRGNGYIMHPRRFSLTVIPGVFGAYGAGVYKYRSLFAYCGAYPDVLYFVDPKTATVESSIGGLIGCCDADSCENTNQMVTIENNTGRKTHIE